MCVVGKIIIIGLDKGLSPDRRQAMIGTTARLLASGLIYVNIFGDILIKIQQFSLRKVLMKWRLRNGVHFAWPQYVKLVIPWMLLIWLWIRLFMAIMYGSVCVKYSCDIPWHTAKQSKSYTFAMAGTHSTSNQSTLFRTFISVWGLCTLDKKYFYEMLNISKRWYQLRRCVYWKWTLFNGTCIKVTMYEQTQKSKIAQI